MRYFAKCAALGLAAACTLFLSACGKDKEITYLEQEPFESSVGGFSAQYLSQYQFANEAAASMVRMERKQALQNLTPNFKDWHVKLLYVSTDSDGDALVKFRSVTNPNIMYDLSVDHGSEFYPTVASLHLNDDAYISGFFKSGDDTDGFRELSFTEKGSMIAPEFKITISAISTSAPAVVSEGAAASAGAAAASAGGGYFEDIDSPLPPNAEFNNNVWTHNGSTVRLYASGVRRTFYYEAPRSGLPVEAGQLLFYGSREGETFFGKAYRFSSKCGEVSYEVTGKVHPSQTVINLSGNAPKRDEQCNVIGTFVDRLKFELLHQ